MDRDNPFLTIIVLIAIVISLFIGGFAFARIVAICLAFGGAYTAWDGRITYGIRGGPALGELRGWLARTLGILVCSGGSVFAFHPEYGCTIFTRYPGCPY
ncbi:MAG: hypothetical protein ABUL52_01230 [Solimonas sp.]